MFENSRVPKGSKTPTFAQVNLKINSPRWDGVPFIMKAGMCFCAVLPCDVLCCGVM